MIPVLYPATERTFSNNGLGGLPNATSCTVTEKRNTPGGYYLEMDYPIDGLHYADIINERIIYASPAPHKVPQPFRIRRVSRPINGIVHIEAPHVSSEVSGITTYGEYDVHAPNVAFSEFATVARSFGQTVNFLFYTDMWLDDAKHVKFLEPVSLQDTIYGRDGSLLDVFGGELDFDAWNIALKKRRGVDTGIAIRYGVNMTDIEAETDAAELVTAVVPYWKGTVNEVDTVVIGDMCSATNASAYAYVRCVPLDVSQQFELEADQQPTQAQVTAKGTAFINSTDLKNLPMSINVKYQPLVENRPINLCDTVKVVHPDLGVSITAKVVETKYNTLIERYDELTIGTMRQTIVDTIARMLGGK